ncbi:MAG: hypothetical protein HXY29_14080 [Rhodocyclaceae bacterium]|nr:hypothetical protein [Rhodocyclaceae bacterium]
MHSLHKRTINDEERFVFNVTSPFLNNQAETWGIPNEVIEEIHIKDGFKSSFNSILEDLLPGMSEATSEDIFTSESYDHGQIYDTMHTIPFLMDHLFNFSKSTNLGYFGCNHELLYLMDAILQRLEHSGAIFVSHDLIKSVSSKLKPLSSRCFIVSSEEVISKSDIFIFDTSAMHLPQVLKFNGIPFPKNSFEYRDFKEKLRTSFLECIKAERQRYNTKQCFLRKFLIISSVNTWFEQLTSSLLDTTLTPYSSRIRHGYIHIDSDLFASRKVDTPELEKEKHIGSSTYNLPDKFWKEAVCFVKKFIMANERLIGPKEVTRIFKCISYSYPESFLEDIDINWALIHKGMLSQINFYLLNHILKTMRPVFANQVFIIFTIRTDIPDISRKSEHYKNFLERVYIEFY